MKKQRNICRDCGTIVGGCGPTSVGPATFNVSYMLERDLWKSIINNEDGSTRGQLCIICAQVRLGRKLKPSDFTSVPLNFRTNGGILAMMFPTEFRAHMRKFVNNEDDEYDHEASPFTRMMKNSIEDYEPPSREALIGTLVRKDEDSNSEE